MTEWIVVVPVKGTELSKTRLAELPASVVFRRQLALAFALDTVEALRTVPEVVEILVVTNDSVSAAALEALEPVGISRVADPGLGLNAAIVAGLAEAHRRRPAAAVAAVTADLPSLTTGDAVEALALAAAHPASFVADLSGHGTTTIAALPGVELVPRFGAGSAHAHATSGLTALPVSAGSTLRLDVDTPGDLARGAENFGHHTSDLLRHAATASQPLSS